MLGVEGSCSKSLLWHKSGSHTVIAKDGTVLLKGPRHCSVQCTLGKCSPTETN